MPAPSTPLPHLHTLIAESTKGKDHSVAALKTALEASEEGLEERDKERRTPLLFAAESGNRHAVETLLSFGANASAVDKKMNNVLHTLLANIETNSREILDVLLNHLGKAALSLIMSENEDGMTPLAVACESLAPAAIVQRLIDAGADVKYISTKPLSTTNRRLPILSVVTSSISGPRRCSWDEACEKAMAPFTADPFASEQDEDDDLDDDELEAALASRRAARAAAEAAKAAGAEEEQKWKPTPASIMELVETLLANGADVKACCADHMTPLHHLTKVIIPTMSDHEEPPSLEASPEEFVDYFLRLRNPPTAASIDIRFMTALNTMPEVATDVMRRLVTAGADLLAFVEEEEQAKTTTAATATPASDATAAKKRRAPIVSTNGLPPAFTALQFAAQRGAGPLCRAIIELCPATLEQGYPPSRGGKPSLGKPFTALQHAAYEIRWNAVDAIIEAAMAVQAKNAAAATATTAAAKEGPGRKPTTKNSGDGYSLVSEFFAILDLFDHYDKLAIKKDRLNPKMIDLSDLKPALRFFCLKSFLVNDGRLGDHNAFPYKKEKKPAPTPTTSKSKTEPLLCALVRRGNGLCVRAYLKLHGEGPSSPNLATDVKTPVDGGISALELAKRLSERVEDDEAYWAGGDLGYIDYSEVYKILSEYDAEKRGGGKAKAKLGASFGGGGDDNDDDNANDKASSAVAGDAEGEEGEPSTKKLRKEGSKEAEE